MKRWPSKALGAICELVNGAPFKPSDWDGAGLAIIRIQNLNDPTKPFNYTSKKLPDKFRVRTGDTLLSWSGTPGTSFGCFRWGGPEGWLNQHIFNVHLNREVLPAFFIYQVNSKLQELIGKARGGVGLQHITKGALSAVTVEVPPLAEQEHIVKLLDEADELRKLRAKADQRTSALVPAFFHEMIRDSDSKNWTQHRFGDPTIMEIIDGDRGKNYPNKTDFREDGYCLFLSTSNVRKGAFDFSKSDFITREKDAALRKGKLTRGDVILTTRGTLGNSAHYGAGVKYDNVRINSGMVILRVNSSILLPEYLLAILNSDGFTNQVVEMTSGSAQPQMPINRLSHIKLTLPPVSLQKEFVERVTEVRELESDQASSRTRLDALFESMLHRAFNGEL